MPTPRPVLARLSVSLLLAAACLPAHAAQVRNVEVRGLDEAMTANVLSGLSLYDALGRELSEHRLRYLLDEAEPEVREALEPFGYYNPSITVAHEGEAVVITVAPGEPVRVRSQHVEVRGPGGEDRRVRRGVEEFEPQVGDVLDHVVYEASKARIGAQLAAMGYFDAEMPVHRVEVTRAERAADIDVQWTSGERYRFGEAGFEQVPSPVVYNSLLHKLVKWDPGDPYRQSQVERLRDSLFRLDYFSNIDIEPQPDAATHTVPVAVTLTPAKRSIYTAGLSYGTATGGAVRLGVERRYLNMRGHKALGELDYGQRRKVLTLQYRMPAFAWLNGWYGFTAQAVDEQSDYLDSRRVELVASRSGEVTRQLTAIVSMHALRERWAYFEEDDGDPDTPLAYRFASFFYPSLRAEYFGVDNRLAPRRGFTASGMLRGGVKTAGISEADFLQAWGKATWYRGLDPRSRLIVRAEAGRTFIEAPTGALAPSLRFFAGGEGSIRGYGWHEVGPRIGPEGRELSVGARHVVTGSVEYERYFSERWGGAVFVDSGSAYNDSPDWRTGVGIGVRWKSPIGPVRVDIARGLDDPDSSFQIYFGLGAEL